jgi:tetratricopeptide (TPR) repeat protein
LKSRPASGPPPRLNKSNVVREKLSRAVSLHQQGNLMEAGRLYGEILKSNKTHVDALQLLGLIYHQTNNSVEAERLLGKAIRLDPKIASFHYNYGLILHRLGRFNEAVGAYDRAIALKADYAEAYLNRGLSLHELGQFDGALESCDRAIALRPDFVEAHSARGSALQSLTRLEEAVASFDRAIALSSDYVEAHYNRGNALNELSRFEEALASYDRAIMLKPDFAEAHSNRGTVLKELRRLDEALASCDRAIVLNPSYVEAISNRGSTLREMKRFDEALASLDRAIELGPGVAEAHSNRGTALKELKRFDEALASYDRAIAINPDLAHAHFSKGVLLLSTGSFRNSWHLYEWRWKIENYVSRPFVTSRPQWAGAGQKRVVAWAEQGVGDEVMFGALLPELRQVSSEVIAKIDARLIPLFARSMPGITFVANPDAVDENAYDEHAALGSLCRYFRLNESSFGATRNGYLVDDKAKTETIRKALTADAAGKKLCGISWRSTNIKTGADRSLDLKAFVEMLPSDKLQFVSLQYGDTAGEIERVKSKLGVTVLSYKDVDNFKDIDGLASLIKACDVVVSVDNTTVHLSGALGQDTRVLLPVVAEWRWQVDRDDSPWYASVRLYRQVRDRDWTGPFEKVKADLSGL